MKRNGKVVFLAIMMAMVLSACMGMRESVPKSVDTKSGSCNVQIKANKSGLLTSDLTLLVDEKPVANGTLSTNAATTKPVSIEGYYKGTLFSATCLYDVSNMGWSEGVACTIYRNRHRIDDVKF